MEIITILHTKGGVLLIHKIKKIARDYETFALFKHYCYFMSVRGSGSIMRCWIAVTWLACLHTHTQDGI